jgi:hypothetical protein
MLGLSQYEGGEPCSVFSWWKQDDAWGKSDPEQKPGTPAESARSKQYRIPEHLCPESSRKVYTLYLQHLIGRPRK